MRNLTKTLAVVSLLAPASAQPLGIGDLKLHSALNQRLNAEINLLLSAGESPSEIQVRMAPPEKFDEAGVPWSYFLSKIKFDTVVKPNGAVVVKLSTNEALREPFLDFLLEVTWTKGNLYREFTVLIDPPVAYEQPVVPVIEKTEQPAPQKEPVAVTKGEETPPATEGIKVDSYGPTARSDTLWQIAEQVKPAADISTEQMMIAIYEANPRAFYKDNVNALMSGKVLNIPETEAILKLSKSQAAKLFRQQVVAWNAPAKKAAEEKPAQAGEEAVASQLDLVAPVESVVEDQVVVSPEQEQAIEEAPTEAATGETEEEAVAGDAGTEELKARLEKLERQLEMMHKLLTLKDEQLAALQNKQQLTEQVQPAPTATQVQPPADAQVAQPQQTPPAKPQPQPPAVKPKAQPAPAPAAPEPDSGMFGDSYTLWVGGLGIAILGGLGWLWWRQRRMEDQGAGIDESMFASSSEIRMPDSEDSAAVSTLSGEEGAAYDVGTVGESSFLSEFTPSDFDAFDSDMNEVDPISEADVYLAYGRYQQAEDLMRQAIADEPTRNDCKLKLLEIFYANENKEAFEAYVGELVQEGKQSDPSFWAKVTEMGNEIIPGSALLAAGAEPSDDSAVHSEVADDQPSQDAADFDLTSFDEDLAGEDDLAKKNEDAESNNDALDFDLSSFDEVEATESGEEEPIAEDDQIESLDFDLDAFGEAEEEKTQLASDAEPEEELESFDFTSAEESVEEASDLDLDVDVDEGEESDESLESFDFSTIEESIEKKDEQEKAALSEIESGETEEFDFSFDFDDASLSGDEESDEEQGVSDLTDMDEFETKIDLAKAYIDMGDTDAAKSIAEEVAENGNDQQKQTAQAILDQLK